MKITWYGHSTFLLETSSAKILMDPFFSGNPVFGDRDFMEVAEGLTHIILTHGHGDHLGDTIPIVQETGATVIANADLCNWLGKNGVSKTDGGNTGGTIFHDGFSVTFVQAHHSSAMVDENGVSHSLGNANGVVLHIDGEKTIYNMGDTDIFGDMALIQEMHQPQIGIVPIGDRYTMGGAVAALACRRFFKFDTVIPCHFATFPGLDATADKFVAAMESEAEKVKQLTTFEATEL